MGSRETLLRSRRLHEDTRSKQSPFERDVFFICTAFSNSSNGEINVWDTRAVTIRRSICSPIRLCAKSIDSPPSSSSVREHLRASLAPNFTRLPKQ